MAQPDAQMQQQASEAMSTILATKEKSASNAQLLLNEINEVQNKQVPAVIEQLPAEEATRASRIVDSLFALDYHDARECYGAEEGMKNMNEQLMKQGVQFTSKALDNKMMNLKDGAEGDVLFDQMVELNDSIKKIHPSNYNLSETFFSKLLPFLSPIRKYFAQYQSMSSMIEGYKVMIEDGIRDRELDLNILKQDKIALSDAELKLRAAIAFNNEIRQGLENKIKMEVTDPDQKKFLEGQILNNLLRQIQGLEEARAVNLQGQMSIEMLIKTGYEIIDGAKRCVNVSLNALKIAAVIQYTITGQRKLLNAVNEVNKTASDLIAWNATTLNTTVLEVSKMAQETSIDIEILTEAIETSIQAIDQDIQFRQNANAALSQNIDRLHIASDKAKDTTDKMAKERKQTEAFSASAANIFA